jgi:PleD family two-component response regulator
MPEGKVVIIEPDPTIVEMLRQPFEAAEFELEAATSGEEGLVLCRHSIPQAALVAADLPDMDGIEVCRQLRATTRTRHIHLVVLARTASRENRIAALELGADDFIPIPFDPDEVTLRIRNALRRAAADNLSDPVTGLPSGRLLRMRLRDLLRETDGWALVGVNVRHLDSFEAAHGFLAAQEVLRSVVRTLSEAVDEWGRAEDFLGCSGGGRFLLVTGAGNVDALAKGLNSRVEEQVRTHHSFRERERGYVVLAEGGSERQLSLVGVEVRTVLPSDGPFYDIRSLTEALG